MGQILLVRHGQASFGTDDYDRLSATGFEQARRLGAWLAASGKRIDRALTGSLRRHRETAETCLAAMPEPMRPQAMHADCDFDEYDSDQVIARYRPELADRSTMKQYLAVSGEPRRAFQEVFSAAMERWMSGACDHEYALSWVGFRDRCVGALARAAQAAPRSSTLVVFTSGGPIAAISQHLLGLSDARAFELNSSLVNGAVTGVLYRPGRMSLHYFNSHAHLEHGDAQLITYR